MFLHGGVMHIVSNMVFLAVLAAMVEDAVMGAFLVTYPADRIKVLWFFGIFAHVTNMPAFPLIGLWLLTQLPDSVARAVLANVTLTDLVTLFRQHAARAFFLRSSECPEFAADAALTPSSRPGIHFALRVVSNGDVFAGSTTCAAL